MENPYQPPATTDEVVASHVAGLKNPRPLALVAVGLYGISVASEIFRFFARRYREEHHQQIHEQFDTMASGSDPLEWLMLGSGMASGIVYLMWKYRAAANARVLNPWGMTVSPAMAVGSYFIPFVFFVVPYRAMVDIARVTLGNASGVGLWWACNVGLGLFSMGIGIQAGMQSPQTWTNLLDHLSMAGSVITFLISIWLVMRITRAQAALCRS